MKINVNKKIICKVLKAFYGLKQAPKLWYKKPIKFLFKKLNLSWFITDHSIFVTLVNIDGLIVNTFIDNIKVIGVKESG